MPAWMVCENQVVSPSLPRKVAIMTRAANHISVSQALRAFKISSHSRTPVRSRIDRPATATVVGSSMKALPKIHAGMPAHTTSMKTSTAKVIFSSIFMGPSFSSSRVASSLAAGVSLISGG